MKKIKWKNQYIQKKLLTEFLEVSNKNKKVIYTNSRRSVIIPSFIDCIFYVYNGKSFVRILIKKEMVGLKLGEFSPTRSKFFFKKHLKLYGSKN
jgi:small subunit ribosomal protein S19